MIKALIVDDEQSSIDLLQWLIGQYCPDITTIKTAKSVSDALPLIQSFQPDLLFLDIQMPHENGFELLSAIENWNFEVIFTTAYNEYAIQAIRFSALDYLLKPVDETELVKAIERYHNKKVHKHATQGLFRNFMQNMTNEKKEDFRLALADASEVRYVKLQEIIRLQADSNYTRIYLSNAKSFVSAKTLKEYDAILKTHGFLRVHKSHLVNPAHINYYNRQGYLHLHDGSVIEVARRKKEYLLQALKAAHHAIH